MGRPTTLLLAGVLLVFGVCGGGLAVVVHALREPSFLEGDGLSPVDDPRPAQAVVRVTDDTGRALAGAEVAAFLEPPPWGDFETKFGFDPAATPVPSLTVRTLADGSTTLTPLGTGDWVIRARAEGRATSFARLVGGHAARYDVRLQLGEPHALTGRVHEPDGGPVAGAIVLACASSDRHFREAHWLTSVRAPCGPRGEFALEGLGAGVVALWVVVPGEVPVESSRVLVPARAAVDLQIPASRTASVIRQPGAKEQPDPVGPRPVATAALVAIAGHVISDDGTPIDGATVAAIHHGPYDSEPALAWTNAAADGSFTLAGVPPDAQIALRVSAAGHLATTTSWDAAEDFVAGATHRLARAVRIVGTVRTPDGTAPRDLRVWIYRLGEGGEGVTTNSLSVLWAGCPMWWWRAPPAPLTAPGRFEATWDFEDGTLVAYAAAEGFAPTVSAPFEVRRDGDPVQVDVVLDRGVPLLGCLLAPDGTPLANRRVDIRPSGFVGVWRAVAATTDAAGRFTVEHLPERPIVVTAGGPGGSAYRGLTVTPTGHEMEIRLRARKQAEDAEDE